VIFHLPYPVQIDFQSLLSKETNRPLNQASRRALPLLRPWVTATLLLATAYIGLSDVLWRQAVSSILSTAEHTIHASAGLPL
jgi:hypothetical protein